MANFVQFKGAGGAIYWVNPDQVSVVSESYASGARTRIFVGDRDNDLDVVDSIEETLEKLS